jgi:biopolymer transport protein TolR
MARGAADAGLRKASGAMAFGRGGISSGATSASASGGRSTGAGGQRPLSDINVTPLVDVMLVLVVIFIVTAPLMASAIRLELPRTDAGRATTGEAKSVRLSVDAAGAVFLDDQPVEPAALGARLAAVAAAGPDTEIALRADRAVSYGRIAELMGIAHQVGLGRIAFVTEAPAAAR